MSDAIPLAAHHDDAPARRAVMMLFCAQSILGAQMPVHFVLGVLAGKLLASDPAFATLPISVTMLTTMFAAPTMSAIMGRWGRRTGFLIGVTVSSIGALLAAHAIAEKDFVLFCVAASCFGVYMGAHGFYRFAATDLASPAFRPKAISPVMAGGLVSAFIGPEIAKQFSDWLEPIPFAGAYRMLLVTNIVGVLPILMLNIPAPRKIAGMTGSGRPWGQILRNRTIVVAMFCAMVSYALMNLAMTSTPLAMQACGFGTGDSADVVRFHIIGMFAPSFFTGALIARFGAPRIIATGLLTLALCSAIAISGITFLHFSVALTILGIGWNFGFIGATSLLAGAHLPEERSRVQGLNDFLVFGLVTIASFSSGALMHAIGWKAVNLAMLPVLAVAAATLGWLVLKERRAALA